jgi:tetratricopeptide (TPR) repeat protein
MKPVPRLAVSVLCAALAPIALAHDEPARESGRLGKVTFENSCAPEVQAKLNRSVAMLHSFWYSAAEKSFTEVISEDPTCGVAAWGLAAILMSNPLAGQGASAQGAQKAMAAIELGRVMGAKTERERDYIEAVAAYYDDWANKPERARQLARAQAYQKLAAKYPRDDEAQIFAALYTAATQQQSDQTYAAYLKAAAVLEEQFRKYPDHPGVAHYLIHSYDAPPIAAKGIPAARLYAGIAPDAPHALHMPSHIFTRVGAWEESAATNKRSMEVAKAGGEPDEAYHANDYMVYAYLQLGRDAEARRTVEEAMRVQGSNPVRFVAPYAMGAMPARLVVERGLWDQAMQLPMPPKSNWPASQANTRFARALGAARSGNVGMAREELAQLAQIQQALEDKKDKYWATEVEVQRLIVAGWIARAQKNDDDALRFLRAAADLEDRNEKHIVTPGRLVPAREQLGELLIEVGQPKAALAEFETSRLREPNRFRNYYMSAVAAEDAGDKASAREYWGKLAALGAKADTDRPEIARAKAALQ